MTPFNLIKVAVNFQKSIFNLIKVTLNFLKEVLYFIQSAAEFNNITVGVGFLTLPIRLKSRTTVFRWSLAILAQLDLRMAD